MDDLFSMPGDPLPPPASSQLLPPSSIGETQYDAAMQVTQSTATRLVHGNDHSALVATTQDITHAIQAQTQDGTLRTVISQSLRKRSVGSDDEDGPDLMNKLFPGAAAMKKRKIQEEEDRAEHPEEDMVISETPKSEVEIQAKKTQTKGKKVKPENPILVAAREVKEEEEKKKREAEDTKGDLDEEAILRLKNLGVVEVMEIKPRGVLMRVNAYGEDSDRWDPRWNGRSNFKKFRKRLPTGMQDGCGMISVRGNVIIPLVEHKSGSGSVFAHGMPPFYAFW